MANDRNEEGLPEFNDDTRGRADEEPEDLEEQDDDELDEDEDEGSF